MLKILSALALALALFMPTLVYGQASLLSGVKGASGHLPVTASSVDADTNALDVNIASGSSSGTEFNVSDVAGATDAGGAVLVIRDDALTTLTPVDGDYVRLRVGSTGALHVTGGGGGTEITEDVASSNPIVGTATLMERDDQLSTVTPVAGDNIGLRGSSEGALWVAIADSSGDPITSFGGGVQHNEDDAAADLDTGTLTLMLRDDTPTASTAANNDYEPPHLDGFGSQYVTLTDAAGAAVDASGLGGGTQHNEDDVAANLDTGTLALYLRDDTPTASTAANNDYEPAHVDGFASLYVTITDASGAAVNAAGLSELAGAIDTQMQVDVVAALPTGSNTIGEVTIGAATGAAGDLAKTEDVAHGSGDIGVMMLGVENEDQATGAAGDKDYTFIATSLQGNVLTEIIAGTVTTVTTVTALTDITGGVVPGVGATDLGKAIDTAVGSTDTGVAALAVRDDTLSTLTPADGDFTVLRVSSTGALHVTGASGATEFAEDTVHSTGAAGVIAMAIRNDSLATLSDTDGDYSVLQVDADGALYVNVARGGGQVEDAVHGSGDSGMPMFAVRDDTPAASTAAAGDYEAIKSDGFGTLYVTLTDASGGSVDASSIGGGTQHNEDDAAANLDTGTLALYLRDDTPSASTAANNDYEPARLDGFGTLYATLTDAAGGSISAAAIAVVGGGTEAAALRVTIANDSTGVVTVDGTVTANPASGTIDTVTTVTTVTALTDITGGVVPGTAAADLGKAEDALHGSGDVGVMLLGVENEDQASGAAGDKDYTFIATSLQGNVLTEIISGTVTTLTTITNDVSIDDGGNLITVDGTVTANLSATDNAVLDAAVVQLDKLVTDPCASLAPQPFAFDITGTTTTEIINESASNKVYICSFLIVTNDANTFALVEDATDACANPDAGVVGGTDAASGIHLAEHGGLTFGNGAGTVLQTASVAMNVCIIASATTQLTGGGTYVYAP